MSERKNKTGLFHRCPADERIWPELEQWYSTPLGQLLAEQEQQQLDDELGNLFGYHLLQLGLPGQESMLRASRVRHRIRSHLIAQSDRTDTSPQLCNTATALPFQSDSLDVVVLSHILEFSSDPHTVLREVERTLIPEGHVVILGFNPVSLWGLARLVRGRTRQLPWCGHFLTQTRLKDWLALLGFDVVQQRRYCYRPPWQRPGLLRRLAFMERLGQRLWPIFGGGQLLVARKRVATLTPIRPRWRARRSIAVSDLVEPMNRQQPHTGVRREPNR